MKPVSEHSSLPDSKFLELMPKLPQDNGNTKSESPRESNAEIICGLPDTLCAESEKNSESASIFNLNLLKETGMDQEPTTTFPPPKLEVPEDSNISLDIA